MSDALVPLAANLSFECMEGVLLPYPLTYDTHCPVCGQCTGIQAAPVFGTTMMQVCPHCNTALTAGLAWQGGGGFAWWKVREGKREEWIRKMVADGWLRW